MVSIRTLFEDAHEIEGIYANSVLEEYGMKRVLVAMFMDAYRPKTNGELLDIKQSGRFDMTVFDAYVAKCRKLGDVFNLWDEKYPFLQWRDAKAQLNSGKSYGEGKIDKLYWDVINENALGLASKIGTAEIFSGLCAYNVYLSSKNGEGYPPNINGSAPFYLWVQAANIFEELVLNAISEEEWTTVTGLPYGESGSSIGTHWTLNEEPLTNKGLVEEHKKNKLAFSGSGSGLCYKGRPVSVASGSEGYTTISLLEGLTYQGKGFLVKPVLDKNGAVADYDVCYRPIYKFNDIMNQWRDPFCCYSQVKGKGGVYTYKAVKPMVYDYTWIDLLQRLYGDIGNKSCQRPLVAEKFGSFALNDIDLAQALRPWGIEELRFKVYAARGDGGKYWWMKAEDLDVNAEIFAQSKQTYYLIAVQALSEVGKTYKKGVKDSIFDYTLLDLTDYYLQARAYLENTFTVELLSTTNSPDDALTDFYDKLLFYASQCYEDSFKNYFSSQKAKKTGPAGETIIVNTYAEYYTDQGKLRAYAKKKLGI